MKKPLTVLALTVLALTLAPNATAAPFQPTLEATASRVDSNLRADAVRSTGFVAPADGYDEYFDTWEVAHLGRTLDKHTAKFPRIRHSGVTDRNLDGLDDDGRFTLTSRGSSICWQLSQDGRTHGAVVARKSCAAAKLPPRTHKRTAPSLAARAADALGTSAVALARGSFLDARATGVLAAYTPEYVGPFEITGITDKNGDGLDDDGRVTVSVADDSVKDAACLVLSRESYRVTSGPCR